ncbi:cytochrome c biogenesis protein ResB [Geobacter sp. DSM 9736]|uniref:cytochrome c biogenesis protein ResB n=1 Tax=Geobacter sp. DSM 9736 TaxID=1277350 RepID=UPI000B60CE10|nr:cytochrome c biogenesis protein ResB [Geobacter sp. DSM 9736]SNB47390.1 Cytochrome c biogenesis protein ResB [Geobacter sp. DSM 9736]
MQVFTSLNKFLLSRRTVLALTALLVASLGLTFIFPQRFLTNPEKVRDWYDSHPFWEALREPLALDHIYTSPWFAILVGLFTLCLLVSSGEQFRRALQRLGSCPADISGAETAVDAAGFASRLRRAGFRPAATNGGVTKYVKNPWGYFAGTVLHAAMVVTIAASLVITLTQQRGSVQLVEGETFPSGAEWTFEEKGLLAKKLILPDSVTLNQVMPEFWSNDDLKQVTSNVAFQTAEGAREEETLSINNPLRRNDITLYQPADHGTAFHLEFVPPAGEPIYRTFLLQNPARRDKASYGNFNLPGHRIKAKFYADAARSSMSGIDPLLVLRLVDLGKVAGEASFRIGTEGGLGPYQVRCVGASRWTKLTFTRIHGMSGVFIGFLGIIIGAGLSYFTPPLECLFRQSGSGILVSWGATNAYELYREECARVLHSAGNGETA